MADAREFQDRLLSLGLARVSEAAALASADLIGRGDEKAADLAAVNAMREQLNLLDKPGALAKIATCLGEAGVSIDQMRQYGHQGVQAPVLIVTHKASQDDIAHAIARFGDTGVLVGAPVALRIEEV